MPIRTQLLDNGNFVRSPELPLDPDFSEYLDVADRLMARWREVEQQWNRSAFSPEVWQRKEHVGRLVREFVDCFQDRFTIKHVQQDPAFLPISQFLARHRPVRKPFSILHCDLEIPLHTVDHFYSHDQLARLNAAVAEDTPLAWWQPGPSGRPCYLFGHWVWELKPSEVGQSEAGIMIAFQQASERNRSVAARLTLNPSGALATTPGELISEKLRVAAWRRAGGRCARCGSREALEFDYIVPPRRGGRETPDNVEVLCSACFMRKHQRG